MVHKGVSMKLLIKAFAVSAGLMICGNASAFVCTADPKAYLAVGGDGLLYTAIDTGAGNAIVAICSVSSNDGSATPQACTAWYSMLLTLRSTGGKALPHFNTTELSNAGLTGCPSISSWHHHVPYFMLAQ